MFTDLRRLFARVTSPTTRGDIAAMVDQPQETDLTAELHKELADIKRERKASETSGNILTAKANRLADELERTDFSDVDAAEKKAMKDLNIALAEEMTSLKDEERTISLQDKEEDSVVGQFEFSRG